MSYEFRVTELAGEFNVHRNTIRNWINSGILPAEKTAGRRYRVKKADYTRLCEKFGRKPLEHTSSEPDLEALRAMTAGSPPPSHCRPQVTPCTQTLPLPTSVWAAVPVPAPALSVELTPWTPGN